MPSFTEQIGSNCNPRDLHFGDERFVCEPGHRPWLALSPPPPDARSTITGTLLQLRSRDCFPLREVSENIVRDRLSLEPALILALTKIRPPCEALAYHKQAHSSHLQTRTTLIINDIFNNIILLC
jgi:hypothetical protein